jgi:hypothetical protein
VPLGKERIDPGRGGADVVTRGAIDRGDSKGRAVGGVTDRGREPERNRGAGFLPAGLLCLGREARGGGDDSPGCDDEKGD